VIDLDETPVKIGSADYPITFWRLPEGVTIVKNSGNATPAVATLQVMPRDPTAPMTPVMPTSPK
jgi:hypothetical protein